MLVLALGWAVGGAGCNGDDGGLFDDDDGNGNGTTTNGDGTVTTTAPTPTTGDTEPATDGLDDTTNGPAGTTNGGDTGPALGCGNGMLDAGEECDGTELGGMSCSDQGFDDGSLACSDTCTLDTSGCYSVEALQNDNGMCDFQELGCYQAMGTAGNPQDLVECYESNLTPPIDVVTVQYSLGDSETLPTALDLVVYAWDGPGTPPGALIGQLSLDPVNDIVSGMYELALEDPVSVPQAGFCVGFHGEDPMEGFRVDFTDADGTGESWVRAEECGQLDFIEAGDIAYPGNFCIRPTVTSSSMSPEEPEDPEDPEDPGE